jgi:hypothetical protein
VLLRAIDETLPKDAVLCLEGTSIAPDVAAYLEDLEPDDPPPVARNTLWPRSRVFHLPLTGANLHELRTLAERHAEPEIADHLVVYRGETVLLWAHDAGYGYVAVSSELPEQTLAAFTAALGPALRPRP